MKICTSRPSEEEMLEPPQGFLLSLKGGEEGRWGVGCGVWGVRCEVDVISLSHLRRRSSQGRSFVGSLRPRLDTT